MKNKWNSIQSVIVSVLILLIFSYIVIDMFLTKPRLEKEVNEVKNQYVELSSFLDKKIPQIDSTFKNHAFQIKREKEEMDTLKTQFNNIK